MSLIDKVKALLGIEETPPPRPADDVSVTVEHEPTPDIETESAVKTEEIIEEAEPASEASAESEPAQPATEEGTESGSEVAAEPESVAHEEPEPTEPESVDDMDSDDPVTDLKGIGASYADRLADADIQTVGDLAAADVDDVAERTGISTKRLVRWVDRANDH